MKPLVAPLPPALVSRLRRVPNGKGGEERVFVLAWRGDDPAESVYLSQVDVRRLQEAKAAIATGWKMLVRRLGIEEREIQQVLLGGSFGAYLTPASAVRIGLVPPLAVTRIVAAGNGQSVNAHVIRRRIAGAGERALRGKLGQPTTLLNSAANFETCGIQLELKGQRCFACGVHVPAETQTGVDHLGPALPRTRTAIRAVQPEIRLG